MVLPWSGTERLEYINVNIKTLQALQYVGSVIRARVPQRSPGRN